MDVTVIAVGIAPVDMIPTMNAVGNPDVVDPVPMNPKLGSVRAPAENDVLDPKNDPAENPPALNAVCAVVPVIIEPVKVPILPTNGASRNVKLLVADATEVTADVALLTNHEMLLVAFWVSAVIPLAAAIDIELSVMFVVPVCPDTAANPPEDNAPIELYACPPYSANVQVLLP